MAGVMFAVMRSVKLFRVIGRGGELKFFVGLMLCCFRASMGRLCLSTVVLQRRLQRVDLHAAVLQPAVYRMHFICCGAGVLCGLLLLLRGLARRLLRGWSGLPVSGSCVFGL